MTKLKCKFVSQRQYLDKCIQQAGVCLEIWRELEEHWSEFARLPHRLQAPQKKTHRLIRFFQSLEVGNGLVGLGGEPEARSGGGNPSLDHIRSRHTFEGCVQFHRIQSC